MLLRGGEQRLRQNEAQGVATRGRDCVAQIVRTKWQEFSHRHPGYNHRPSRFVQHQLPASRRSVLNCSRCTHVMRCPRNIMKSDEAASQRRPFMICSQRAPISAWLDLRCCHSSALWWPKSWDSSNDPGADAGRKMAPIVVHW